MTQHDLIERISAGDESPLLKAQVIATVRNYWRNEKQFELEPLLELCAKITGATAAQVRSRLKFDEYIRAKKLFVYYVFKHRKMNLTDVAKFLNLTHHTSVIHLRDSANDLLKVKDFVFTEDLRRLETALDGGHVNYPKQIDRTRNVFKGIRVKNTETGQIFNSISAAAKHEGVKVNRLWYNVVVIRSNQFNYKIV